MFGSTLYKDGTGEVGTKASLKDKTHVAVFFGAAWSGSCKQFLQPLVTVYKKLTDEKKKSFEIVYVPATVPGRPAEDEASFKELMSLMPWLGVPHHRKSVHKKLTRRFQVVQVDEPDQVRAIVLTFDGGGVADVHVLPQFNFTPVWR